MSGWFSSSSEKPKKDSENTSEEEESPVKVMKVVEDSDGTVEKCEKDKKCCENDKKCCEKNTVQDSNEKDDDKSSDEDEASSGETSSISEYKVDKNDVTYVLCANGSPIFFTDNEKEASKVLWSIAKRCRRNVSRDAYCNVYMNPKAKNCIEITGSYNFVLVSYDQVIHRLTYRQARRVTSIKE